MSVCVSVCVCVRERVCVREKESVCACVCERETVRVCACVCERVCAWERGGGVGSARGSSPRATRGARSGDTTPCRMTRVTLHSHVC